MSQITIGTAGHIDHGKTALVKALTGVNTDRLREEQERGLTIDLGFAHLGDHATIIDVPGHEKFVRNMVAGVSTIDLVLFVVAADDGVMPQTREHLDILNILQVRHGLIVITKTDLVDDDWLSLVSEDIRALVKGSFLATVPVIPFSAITGEGLNAIQSSLEEMLATVKEKRDRGAFWLPVDRVFTMKGFGTVATGTVLSGHLSVGDSVELLPGKIETKVRGLQSHSDKVASVKTGDRAAINLQTIEKRQLHRGDVLALPKSGAPSRRMDVKLQLLQTAPRALKHRTRIRVHFGTTEVMARVSLLQNKAIEPGGEAFIQLVLEAPAAARRLDPFVIRQYSPTVTIGGGVILDPGAATHKRKDMSVIEKLHGLEKEDPGDVLQYRLLSAGFSAIPIEHLATEISIAKELLLQMLDALKETGTVLQLKIRGDKAVMHRANFEGLCTAIINAVAAFHEKHPTKFGMAKPDLQNTLINRPDLQILNLCLKELVEQKKIKEAAGIISLTNFKIELSEDLQKLRQALSNQLYEEGFTTSSESDFAKKFETSPAAIKQVLDVMIGMHEIILVDNILFHKKRVEEAAQKVVGFLQKNGEMTVSQFKDLIGGASRKYAMPLLNHFDGSGVTERVGDVRILRN